MAKVMPRLLVMTLVLRCVLAMIDRPHKIKATTTSYHKETSR
jgi:hypothetical protein